jgi:hypothetical protein
MNIAHQPGSEPLTIPEQDPQSSGSTGRAAAP